MTRLCAIAILLVGCVSPAGDDGAGPSAPHPRASERVATIGIDWTRRPPPAPAPAAVAPEPAEVAAAAAAGDADGDRDVDDLPDVADRCPDAPEDTGGFEDNDGCPDPSVDVDAVPDGVDRSPGDLTGSNAFEASGFSG